MFEPKFAQMLGDNQECLNALQKFKLSDLFYVILCGFTRI